MDNIKGTHKIISRKSLIFFGGAKRDRTADLLNAINGKVFIPLFSLA